MNADRLIKRMDRFRHTVHALKESIPTKDAHWKPAAADWSIVEILSHLVDTETDDMRIRLRLTLEDPAQEWPAIDPAGWPLSRHYAKNDLHQVVDRFLIERAASVDWLRTLNAPDWSATHQHPKLAAIRAGDILTAWCAHDALHLRQIAKRAFQLTQRDAEPYHSDYAGAWKA